ncbi:MAG: hypothetical protein U1E53_20425 [Dongiaceae bacterium]
MAASPTRLTRIQRAIGLLLPAILGIPLLLGAAAPWVPSLKQEPLAKEPPAPDPAAPTWTTWRDRSFQRGLEAWLTQALPPRHAAVELANQLSYDLFAVSPMDRSIVVGRGGALFWQSYVEAWCSSRPDAERLQRRADRIAALRDRFERAGRALIVLIAPSKATVMPELLPAACPPPADPAGPRRLLAGALAERGVHVVDGYEAVMAMKRADPLPPFPRGGIHWSRLAAWRMARVVIEEAGRISGVDLGGLAVGEVGWDSPPNGDDADLAILLNLRRPPVDYRVGLGTVSCRATTAGAESTLLALGGSFLKGPLGAITRCRLFGQVDYFYYYTRFHHRWPEDRRFTVDRAAIDWRSTLARTRVLLLEMNEELIAKGGDTDLDRFLDDALTQLH